MFQSKGDSVHRMVAIALTAIVFGSMPAHAQLRLETFVSGVNRPTDFVQDPGNPSVQYVVEQGGLIRVIQRGTLLPTPFLDLSSIISLSTEDDYGLLGAAFPHDYSTSGRFIVNYTNLNGDTVIARYQRSAGNPLVADPSTHFELRWGG